MNPFRFASVFGIMLVLGQLAFGQVDEARLREKLTASTVLIATELPAGEFYMGTGWVVSRASKHIVTAYHVVNDAVSVSVILPAKDADGWIVDQTRVAKLPRLAAQVVRTAPESDLAVLQVPDLPARMPELELADDYPEANAKVYAVGHPSTTTQLYRFIQGDF